MKVIYTTTLNGKDYTQKTVFPIKMGKLLDEQLDEASIQMILCKEESFDMLSPVKIELSALDAYGQVFASRVDHYVIANDRSFLMIKDKNLYRHDLYLIEETKLLEGLIGDSIVFTNTLGNIYTLNAPMSPPISSESRFEEKTPSYYKTTLEVGQEFTFVAASTIYQDQLNFDEGKLIVFYNGTREFESYSASYTTLLKVGTYVARYESTFELTGGEATKVTEYFFSVVENHYPLKKWTITDVVQRTLDLIEPHIDGIPNRFTFNEAQAEEYSNVIAPEFAFTKENLRERLQQIGGFIHAEPRLRDGVIYFDKYGQTDYANIVGFKVTSKAVSQDINQYATDLDSSVDNLISSLSWAKGVIMEPFAGGYRSVRTESYNVRITEDNMLIQTVLPIYQVEKLVCGYIKDGELKTCDITPYVFESTDYHGSLSSYSETYPTSKSYGIYYTQGAKNIMGLTYKVPNAVSDIFSNYAIVNILAAASGEPRTFFTGYGYPKLMFQITYLPIFSTRVTQTKQYTVGMKTPFAMPYNQSANLIETAYYGENMKGLIARLGNVEKTVTYTIYNPNDIPTPGQLYDDDYYISAVYTEFMPGYIKLQLTLSKDFNRLSKYISIPSYKRYYEISERQAFKRETLYTDYLVIGDPVQPNGEEMTGAMFLSYLKASMTQEAFGIANTKITYAKVWGKNKQKEKLSDKAVLLPVISTAMGTTMNFSFIAEDNYSAGARSVYGEYEGADHQTLSGYWQQYVPYGDYYGRMYYLNFHLLQNGTNWSDVTKYEEEAMENPLDVLTVSETDTPLIGTPGSKPILYRKDSREILGITYQATFVTNKKDIVIGSALAAVNPLIVGSESKLPAKLYLSPTRINKFDDFVDVSGMTAQTWDPSDITINQTILSLGSFTSSMVAKAWAIIYSPNEEDTEITVEDEDGTVMTQTIPVGDRLLIACNTYIPAGKVIQLPSISIVHNIYGKDAYHNVTYHLTNCIGSVYNPTVVENMIYELNFTANAGYKLPTTISATNCELVSWDSENGVAEIRNFTGDVVVTVTATKIN